MNKVTDKNGGIHELNDKEYKKYLEYKKFMLEIQSSPVEDYVSKKIKQDNHEIKQHYSQFTIKGFKKLGKLGKISGFSVYLFTSLFSERNVSSNTLAISHKQIMRKFHINSSRSVNRYIGLIRKFNLIKTSAGIIYFNPAFSKGHTKYRIKLNDIYEALPVDEHTKQKHHLPKVILKDFAKYLSNKYQLIDIISSGKKSKLQNTMSKINIYCKRHYPQSKTILRYINQIIKDLEELKKEDNYKTD